MFANKLAGADVVATTIQPNDRIVVTIAPTQGGRVKGATISETFDGEGYRLNGLDQRLDAERGPALNLNGGGGLGNQPAPPTFDKERYLAAVKASDGAPSAEARGIEAEYNLAMAKYKQQYGTAALAGPADIVAKAVLAWAKAVHNIQDHNGDHAWVDPRTVMTKPPVRTGNNPVTFVVQIAPVWGIVA